LESTIDQELADAAAYVPGGRFMFVHQVAAKFLGGVTSWPPSRKCDVNVIKSKIRRSMHIIEEQSCQI